MSKFMYVGPTIIGVATRNTVYDGVPDTLRAVEDAAPYLLSLCVPLSGVSDALQQIAARDGAIYTLYTKALGFSVKKGAK